MKTYSVDFESTDQYVTISIKNIYADSGEEAIEKAKRHLHYPHEWECIGLDRMKDD